MARTAVYTTGEKGRNRVQVYLRGKAFYLRWWVDTQEHHRGLGHKHLAHAKQEADRLAAALVAGEAPTALTLGWLFDKYLAERDAAYQRQQITRNTLLHDRKVLTMALAVWGRGLDPYKVTQDQVQAYLRRREALGSLAKDRRQGARLGGRILQQDVKALRAAFNWAVEQRPPLLKYNPITRRMVPPASQAQQVSLTDQEIQRLFAVAPAVHPYAPLMLALSYETGHRIGAIRQLTWADLDLTHRLIHWAKGTDKSEYEHYTPLPDPLLPYLKAHPVRVGCLFPRRRRGVGLPVARGMPQKLWTALETAAGLSTRRLRGWHSFRRRFANDLRDVNLKDLAAIGGWKSANTLLSVYLQATPDTMRSALQQRHRTGTGTGTGHQLHPPETCNARRDKQLAAGMGGRVV